MFKKEIMKILKELRVNMKELRADINSTADYFRKEPENMTCYFNIYYVTL